MINIYVLRKSLEVIIFYKKLLNCLRQKDFQFFRVLILSSFSDLLDLHKMKRSFFFLRTAITRIITSRATYFAEIENCTCNHPNYPAISRILKAICTLRK